MRSAARLGKYSLAFQKRLEGGKRVDHSLAGALETGHGIVTDVCLKRKVRNFVDLTRAGGEGYNIYVREKAILNQQHERAYKAIGLDSAKAKSDDIEKARAWMCQNFYDVRTFGAVMSTGVNCGQVRGPVQIAFAKSRDPVVPREITVTRMAVTTEKEAEAQKGGNRTMGSKFIIPYALYGIWMLIRLL